MTWSLLIIMVAGSCDVEPELTFEEWDQLQVLYLIPLLKTERAGCGCGICTEISKDPGKGTPLYFATTHLSSKKCGK